MNIAFGGSMTFDVNTIAGNSAATGAGGFRCASISLGITNTIFWNNDSPDGNEVQVGDDSHPAELSLDYTDIEGGLSSVDVALGSILHWGEGMINDDPLFVDAENSDYTLLPDSPCIDTGNPNIPCLPWGGWCLDMGAYEYDQGFYFDGQNIILKPFPIEFPVTREVLINILLEHSSCKES
jgi:hypothetical protein